MDGFSPDLLFIVIYAAVFVLLVVALLPEGDITPGGVFYLPCAKLCKIKKSLRKYGGLFLMCFCAYAAAVLYDPLYYALYLT